MQDFIVITITLACVTYVTIKIFVNIDTSVILICRSSRRVKVLEAWQDKLKSCKLKKFYLKHDIVLIFKPESYVLKICMLLSDFSDSFPLFFCNFSSFSIMLLKTNCYEIRLLTNSKSQNIISGVSFVCTRNLIAV